MQLMERFGRLLAAYRLKRGWTQLRLAEEAQLSHEMITKLEGGKTGASFPTIQRLADALGIEPAALFSPELGKHGLKRKRLDDLYVQLVELEESDAEWALRLIEVALSRKA